MIVTYAIVYAARSKMLRRIIADDEGRVALGVMEDGVTPAVVCIHTAPLRNWLLTSSLVRMVGMSCGYHRLLPGETALIVSKSSDAPAHGFFDWCDQVFRATGVYPPRIRCALVDRHGIVHHVIMADPDIDGAPEGFALVRCGAGVKVGDVLAPLAMAA